MFRESLTHGHFSIEYLKSNTNERQIFDLSRSIVSLSAIFAEMPILALQDDPVARAYHEAVKEVLE